MDARKLEAKLKADKSELGAESGDALDRTFLQQEIEHHKQVISEIENPA